MQPRYNVVYAQNFFILPSLVYDRQIPIGEKIGVIPSVGVGVYGTYFLPLFTASVYYGNPKHRADLGATYWDFEGIAVFTTYRYTAKSGFFAKAGFLYFPEEEGIPIVGIGYSF